MSLRSLIDLRAGGAEIDGRRLIKVAIVILFLVAAFSRAAQKDLTSGFDEVAHVSYVAHIQSSGEAWPDLTQMRLLYPRTFLYSDLPNYLNHPSPYYWMLAKLGARLEGHPEALARLRVFNILMVAVGLAALLSLGRERNRSKLEEYAWYIPLFAIPVLAHLASAVNNDNLAFLGGALALVSTRRLLESRQDKWLFAALASVVIAGLAKLTGLLLVGGLVGGVLALLVFRGQHKVWWIVAALGAAALAATPYLALWAQYGGLAPDTPGQILLLQSTAPADLGWEHAPRLSFLGYAANFVKTFIAQWVPTPLERNALEYAMLAAPVIAICIAFAGFVVSGRRLLRGADEPTDALVAIGFATIAFTFIIHLAFSYRHHLAYAYVADAYPRYYLPLGAIVPLACLALFSAVRAARLREALTLLTIAGPIAVVFFGVPSSDAPRIGSGAAQKAPAVSGAAVAGMAAE